MITKKLLSCFALGLLGVTIGTSPALLLNLQQGGVDNLVYGEQENKIFVSVIDISLSSLLSSEKHGKCSYCPRLTSTHAFQMVQSSYFVCLPLQSSRKKIVRALPSADGSMAYGELSSISTVQNKDSIVRLVFSSGMVETYDSVISAYSVMQKYPRLCLARPEIFKRPHDSLVGPKELLWPGQKFYLVPKTTVKKLLQQDNYKRTKAAPEVIKVEKEETVENNEKEGKEEEEEESVCSANNFSVSNDGRPQHSVRRSAKEKPEEKRFNPPMTTRKGVRGGWMPTLSSIQEISP